MTIPAEYMPPVQEPGESAAAYIERCEWHRKRVPADILHAPIRGHVAGSDGIKHWTEADYLGDVGGPQTPNPKVFRTEQVYFAPLAPVRKRTPAQRMEEVRVMLLALAVQSYDGMTMHLPASVCEKLVRLGVYKRIEDAAKDTVEDVARKFDIYAQALLHSAPTSDMTPTVSTDRAVPPATTQEAPALVIAGSEKKAS